MAKIIDNRKSKNCVFENINRGDFYINSKNNLCIKTASAEGFDLEKNEFICYNKQDVISPVTVEISIFD